MRRKERFYCKSCDTECNDKQQLLEHCNGQKHKRLLERSKQAKKEPKTQQVASKIKTSVKSGHRYPAGSNIIRKRHLNHIQNTVPAKVAKLETGKDVKESQLYDENENEEYEVNKENNPVSETTYDRSGYADTAHGINYQRLLTLWTLIQACGSQLQFKLGAEASMAGKWDDLYLYFQNECIRLFFQIKHTSSNVGKIMLSKVVTGKDEVSFKEMIKSIDKLVPCNKNKSTNIAAVFYTNKSIFNDISDGVELLSISSDLLKSLQLTSIVNNRKGCFKVKITNTKILEELASETGLTTPKVEENLDRILFITYQWGVEELKTNIMDEIKTMICSEHVEQAYGYIMQQVQSWMEDKKGSYFDREKFISICKKAKICQCN